MTFYKTDDPIRDAERAQQDPRPLVGECAFCGCEVRGEAGINGCDPHYVLPGYGLIHYDCFLAWAHSFLREG